MCINDDVNEPNRIYNNSSLELSKRLLSASLSSTTTVSSCCPFSARHRSLHNIRPPFPQTRPVIMCMQIFAGNTKYLSCGHITESELQHRACLSSTCSTSPNHPFPCRRGVIPGCVACTRLQACNHHHTCTPQRRFEERIDHIVSGLCPACATHYS